MCVCVYGTLCVHTTFAVSLLTLFDFSTQIRWNINVYTIFQQLNIIVHADQCLSKWIKLWNFPVYFVHSPFNTWSESKIHIFSMAFFVSFFIIYVLYVAVIILHLCRCQFGISNINNSIEFRKLFFSHYDAMT